MTVKELSNMRKSELLTMAKKLKMKGFSRLTKSELIEKLVDFISDSGDILKDKAKELLTSVKLNAPLKTKTAKVKRALKKNKSDSSAAEEPKAKAKSKSVSTKTKVSSSKRSTPSMKVLKVVGIPEPRPESLAPESSENEEFLARKKVESLRYKEVPLYIDGEIIPPEALRDIDEDLPDLPLGYGDGAIHLMPRDPRWLFCYWDISEENRLYSGKNNQSTIYLKLHDVTHIDFDGNNSWSVQKFRLNEEARFWYIPVPSEGRQFIAEIGYSQGDGSWRSFGFSDGVIPPPSSKSPWVHDVFISLPFDKPLPVTAFDEDLSWLEPQASKHADTMNQQFINGEDSNGQDSNSPDSNRKITNHNTPQIPRFGTPTEPAPYYAIEGTVTSPGPRGVSSFVHIKDQNGIVESFPLTIEGDLRVFGATEPNASLTIDGNKTEVNSDGTFSVTIPLLDKSVSHKVIATGEKGEAYSIDISIERNNSNLD
jgi:uncharacterized protein